MTVSPFTRRTILQIERDEARAELEHARQEIEALRAINHDLHRQLIIAVIKHPEAFEAE